MWGFARTSVWASRLCLVPVEVRRGYRVPKNWSHSQLDAATWVLRIEYRSSGREASINARILSPAPVLTFSKYRRKEAPGAQRRYVLRVELIRDSCLPFLVFSSVLDKHEQCLSTQWEIKSPSENKAKHISQRQRSNLETQRLCPRMSPAAHAEHIRAAGQTANTQVWFLRHWLLLCRISRVPQTARL